MKKHKFYLSFLLFFSFIQTMFSQSESGDFFRNIGKIYVVVAVLLVIFIGLVIFLIYLDKRISKLEQNQNEK